MIKKIGIILTFALFLALLQGCVTVPEHDAVVEINGKKVYAEVVDTPETKALGLMHREWLGKDSGMLFVWESEQPLSFWMKNTLIPLDILYISSDMRVIDIQQMEPCTEDPCKTYPSADLAQYALEVNEGFSDLHGIKVGHEVVIN